MFHPGCNSSCFKVLSLVDGKIIAMNIVDNWSVVWIIRNEWKKTINQLVGAWFSTCAFWGFLFFLSLSSSIHLFWMNLFMYITHKLIHTTHLLHTHTPRQLLSLWNGSFTLRGFCLSCVAEWWGWGGGGIRHSLMIYPLHSNAGYQEKFCCKA